MKRRLSILTAFLSLIVLSGCAFYVSEDSYARAARNEYVMKFSAFDASKSILRSKVLRALEDRGWIVESDGDPIKAKLYEIRQTAVASFSVSDNSISVDTKGSMVDGNKPYVPVRYVNNVIASVRKYLDKGK